VKNKPEGSASGDDADQEMRAGPLDPPLAAHAASPEILAARERADAEDIEASARHAVLIAAHVTTLRMVLDTLEADHQAIADQRDFDLVGDTRYAATWQLAGRCIGLARGVVALVEARYCAETLALARTLHECSRLLDAVSDREDGTELLQRWLDDERKGYVRPWEARAAEERADRRHRQVMLEAGAKPIEPSAHLSGEMYDHLSWTSHNRRRAVQDFVDVELHRMVRGPHPDARVVAVYANWVGLLVEETLLSVGYALARFAGGASYLRDRQIPLQHAIRAAREDSPLT
jgi:hypothetical protein